MYLTKTSVSTAPAEVFAFELVVAATPETPGGGGELEMED